MLYATCAKLLNYPDKPAPPARSSSPRSPGRFRALGRRQDVHVHDPRGLSLLAALERARDRRDVQVHDRAQPEPEDQGPRPGTGFLADIVGARRRTWPARRGTSPASSPRGDTLTIRLVAPLRLRAPACDAVLLRGADRHPDRPQGVRLIPSAGPTTSPLSCLQGSCSKRNPNYEGSRLSSRTRIELTAGVSTSAVAQIEAGRADYAARRRRPRRLPRLATRYGPASPAAKKARSGTSKRHAGSTSSSLNTHRPALPRRSDPSRGQLRDRPRALARLECPRAVSRAGPPTITCRRVYPDSATPQIYPFSPISPTARRLARAETAERRALHLQRLALRPAGPDPQGEPRRDRPRRRGQGASPSRSHLDRRGSPGEPYDLVAHHLVSRLPGSRTVLNFLLEGGLSPPFHYPVYTRELEAAARLSGPTRYLAYGKLDADLARDPAPWVAYGTLVNRGLLLSPDRLPGLQPAGRLHRPGALCLRP